jgi:hypothetical protein
MNTHEARIIAALSEFKMPAETFCKISGISSSRWNRAISGTKPLDSEECLALSSLIQELRGIIQDATLLPISLRDVESIRRLLELRRGGIKVVGSIQLEEETATEAK